MELFQTELLVDEVKDSHRVIPQARLSDDDLSAMFTPDNDEPEDLSITIPSRENVNIPAMFSGCPIGTIKIYYNK